MKKSTRNKALVLGLVGVMTIGGIAAYFTDGDTQTNTFTVGKISLTFRTKLGATEGHRSGAGDQERSTDQK